MSDTYEGAGTDGAAQAGAAAEGGDGCTVEQERDELANAVRHERRVTTVLARAVAKAQATLSNRDLADSESAWAEACAPPANPGQPVHYRIANSLAGWTVVT